jgi:hypothetical protein
MKVTLACIIDPVIVVPWRAQTPQREDPITSTLQAARQGILTRPALELAL